MEVNYKEKYKMYKNKYLKLKNKLNEQNGSGLESYLNTLKYFGNDWILTGSEAIKQYLLFFDRKDLLTFEPNDVDIIYISNDMIYKTSIDGFERVQSSPNKSMTFKKGNLSFDVTTERGPIAYYEINGLKLMTPKDMLNNYEENLHFRRSKVEEDKMKALEIIKIKVESLEKKRLPILVENSRRINISNDSPNKESPFNKRKGLFDSEDDISSVVPKIPRMGNLFD
jgi:hypothetical protein